MGTDLSHPLDCSVYLADCGEEVALIDAGAGDRCHIGVLLGRELALSCGAYVITFVMTTVAITAGKMTSITKASEHTDTALAVVIP